jgi:hypothetical protein
MIFWTMFGKASLSAHLGGKPQNAGLVASIDKPQNLS